LKIQILRSYFIGQPLTNHDPLPRNIKYPASSIENLFYCPADGGGDCLVVLKHYCSQLPFVF